MWSKQRKRVKICSFGISTPLEFFSVWTSSRSTLFMMKSSALGIEKKTSTNTRKETSIWILCWYFLMCELFWYSALNFRNSGYLNKNKYGISGSFVDKLRHYSLKQTLNNILDKGITFYKFWLANSYFFKEKMYFRKFSGLSDWFFVANVE